MSKAVAWTKLLVKPGHSKLWLLCVVFSLSELWSRLPYHCPGASVVQNYASSLQEICCHWRVFVLCGVGPHCLVRVMHLYTAYYHGFGLI